MTTNQKQSVQQKELHAKLWDMANSLRGSMEASDFKNYILGLIFYRYLSENLLYYVEKTLLKSDSISYKAAWEKKEYRNALIEQLLNNSEIGYVIQPQYLYSSLIELIKQNKFDISMLEKAINELNESVLGTTSQDDFENLFEDMDLHSSKLGKGEKDKSKLIATIMLKVNEINFNHSDSEIDVLGDAYEYLISKFAATAGKKAGEFYTPQQVSKILAKIVTMNQDKIKKVYDPTCGSGSLLLRVAKEANVGSFYGQELTSTTYNLARMNMILHGVPFNRFNIYNGNTLTNPYEKHLNMKFEVIVANPPFGINWSSDPKFLDDERFSAYGKLAPKSTADYAFVQHMLYLLDDKGVMAVVLPHGVLFRGASEDVIRKYIVEKNYIDTVIGLPSNLFYGAAIPTVILVFKKCKTNTDILFIDASKEFEKQRNQNTLTEENIEKILNAYKNRKDIDKYAHVASIDEIKENDYNLNIPRYVNTFEEEEPIDIKQVQSALKFIEEDIVEVTKELNVYLKELGLEEL
jgi:type I restriction enzyme M protein